MAGVALLGACVGGPQQDRGAPGRAAATRSPAALYRFVDVTKRSGLATTATRTWGSAWGDYDRDGDPDLFVGLHLDRPTLYVNRSGSYSPEPRRRFGPVDRHGCAWGEANGDGRPDLYCARGAKRGTGSGPNQLLVQTAGGFAERARRYGVEDPLGRGRTVNWLDHDSDGDLDLFVGNKARADAPNALFERVDGGFTRARAGFEDDVSTISSSWADWDRDGDPDLLVLQYDGPARMYENAGGTFRRRVVPALGSWAWQSGSWGDYDGDGWPDLHVVRPRRSLILHNERGRLLRQRSHPLREGRVGVWLDVDNDADLDVFLAQGARGDDPSDELNRAELLLVQRSDGRFRTVRLPALRGEHNGDADGVAAADHDRDGRVDVFVTNGYRQWSGTQRLLENRSRAGNWFALELRGGPANPFGFGARVRAELGRRSVWRYVTDGFDFRSQSEPGYVHVGLGARASADVRVEWPGGVSDCLEVAAGTIVPLERGARPC